jgi:hypothetical protein
MQSVPCEFVYRGIDARDRDRLCKLSRDVQSGLKGLRVRGPVQRPVAQPPRPQPVATREVQADRELPANRELQAEKELRANRELQAYRLLPSYLQSVNDQMQRLGQSMDSVAVVDTPVSPINTAPAQSIPVSPVSKAPESVPVVERQTPVVPKQMPPVPPARRRSAFLPSKKEMTQPSTLDGVLIPTNLYDLVKLLGDLIGVVNMDEMRTFDLPEGGQITRALKVVRKQPMDEKIRNRIDSTLRRGFMSARDAYELYKFLYEMLPEEQRAGLPAPTWTPSKFVPTRRVDIPTSPPPVSQMAPQPSVGVTPAQPNPFAQTNPFMEDVEYNPFTETLSAPGAVPEEDPWLKTVLDYDGAVDYLNKASNSTDVKGFFSNTFDYLTQNAILNDISPVDDLEDLIRAPNTPEKQALADTYLQIVEGRLADERPQLWDAIKSVLRTYDDQAVRTKVAILLLSEFAPNLPDALLSQLRSGFMPASADVLAAMDQVNIGEAQGHSLSEQVASVSVSPPVSQTPIQEEVLTPEQQAVNLYRDLRIKMHSESDDSIREYLNRFDNIQQNTFLYNWLRDRDLLTNPAFDKTKGIFERKLSADKIMDILRDDWFNLRK